MDRRSFLFKLAGMVLGAPLLAKLGPGMAQALQRWDAAAPDAFAAMMNADAERIGSEIVKSVMRQSPFLDLLSPAAWPEDMGSVVRVTINEHARS
jgi:hypothetical protein